MRKIYVYNPSLVNAYSHQLRIATELLIMLVAATPVAAVCLFVMLVLAVGGLVGSLLRGAGIALLLLACWCGLVSPGDRCGEVNPAGG